MILVVDGDPVFLEEARQVLNRTRQVFLTTNAERAFEMARELGFSVALVDLDLPGEDGFALIRKLRQTMPEISIIAISSEFHNITPEQAEKLGAVEVLTKPITPAWKPVVERIRSERRGT